MLEILAQARRVRSAALDDLGDVPLRIAVRLGMITIWPGVAVGGIVRHAAVAAAAAKVVNERF
jgi:hypothetical protein